MTRERLLALQDIREAASKLWGKLLTDWDASDTSLNFIEKEDRFEYRQMLAQLQEDITTYITDELVR